VGKDFFEMRSPSHLARLISTHYYLRKRLIEISSQPLHQILLKCFPSKIEGKKVLSLAFTVHLSHSFEIPEEKHLSLAISRFLPGIKIIPKSFYSYLERSSLLLFCYLEIEKPWGNKIAFEQISLLQQKLPNELLQCIQSLTPSLFIPYNQEEVYKNIVQLAKELHSARDLPQIIITSQAQSRELLCFQIIAVRIKKKSPLSFDRLSSSIRLSSQKIIPLRSPSKLQKEALVLQFEIDSHLFLRRNWKIDQRQARNCVVKTLEQLLGPFRDYNGGLFYQQDKQFEQISKNFKRNHELLYPIEELFYALSPSFQILIPLQTATRLFSLFANILKKELPSEGFLIAKKKHKEDLLLILKTNDFKLCGQFLNQIKSQFKQDDSSIGFSSIEYQGMHYVCLVDLNSLHLSTLSEMEQQFKQESSDEPQKRNILRINFQEGDPPSLNPHLTGDIRSRTLGKALFEGLTRLNPKGVPELAAASKVKISSCQTIYTFLLREHHWSNGELVTAYDFEQAWKKALYSRSDCLYSDLFYIIKNAKAAKQEKRSAKEVKIKALNTKTLQVELEHPASHFLHLIAHPAFSPMYKDEEEPIHFNGPFIVKQWQRDHFLHLTINPYYWDKKRVSLQGVFISLIKDVREVAGMFNRKELDWIGNPFNYFHSQDISSHYLSDKRNQTMKVDRVYWIWLNTLSFPLQSAKIRKALSVAINRKQIICDLFNGYIPLLTPIPNSQSTKSLSSDGNIRLAQQLFKEGLKELNLTQKTFPKITLNYSDIPGQDLLAKMIKNQIEAALKITVNLAEIPWDAYLNLINKKEYQLAGYFKSPSYFDPSSHLEVFRERFHSANASQWENPIYSSLLEQANKTFDQKMRAQLLKRAEEILLEEMPIIPLFQQVYKCLIHPKIKKIAVYKNGDVDLKFTLL
jgi:oligopeptide transport system substrate-binding protein